MKDRVRAQSRHLRPNTVEWPTEYYGDSAFPSLQACQACSLAAQSLVLCRDRFQVWESTTSHHRRGRGKRDRKQSAQSASCISSRSVDTATATLCFRGH
eukprot:3311055-Rhodomonas_salina.2